MKVKVIKYADDEDDLDNEDEEEGETVAELHDTEELRNAEALKKELLAVVEAFAKEHKITIDVAMAALFLVYSKFKDSREKEREESLSGLLDDIKKKPILRENPQADINEWI